MVTRSGTFTELNGYLLSDGGRMGEKEEEQLLIVKLSFFFHSILFTATFTLQSCFTYAVIFSKDCCSIKAKRRNYASEVKTSICSIMMNIYYTREMYHFNILMEKKSQTPCKLVELA